MMGTENDVNNAEVITPSGVVEPVAATENVSQVEPGAGVEQTEGVTQEAAAAPAEQQAEQTEENRIPLSRLNEVIAERDAARAEITQRDEHITLLGNQQQPQQAQQQPGQQQQSLTLQVMKQAGIDPELATSQQILEVFDTVSQIRAQQSTSQNQAQQFVSANADYADVVGVTDGSGRFTPAPPLLRAMQKDSQLAADLQAAGTGAGRLAYKIAVNDPAYQQQLIEQNKPAPQVAGESADQAIKAAASMTSVSAVGSSGVIDKTALIKNMTDEQFTVYRDDILRKGGIPVN